MSEGANRSPRRLIAALVALPALILTVGPLALGSQAKQTYQNHLGELLHALPTGWVVLEHYDRGWFSSSAQAELALQPSPGAGSTSPRHIRLDSRVNHGPWHWFSALPPVLTRVQTRVEWTDLGLPPLQVRTDFDLGGGTRAHLRLPAGEQAGRHWAYRLRNGDLAGTLDLTAAGRLILDLHLPSLTLLAPAGTVAHLADLTLKGNLEPQGSGFYSGRADLAVAAAGLGDGAGPRVEGLNLALSLGSPQPDLRLDLSADTLGQGTRIYREARLGFTSVGLDAGALEELAQGLKLLSTSAPSPALRGLVGAALMARLLPRLAAAGPRIRLDPLVAQTPEGPASARLELGLTPGGNPDQAHDKPFGDLGPWIEALTGSGEIDLPESLLGAWMDPVAEAPPGPAVAGEGPAQPPPTTLHTWVEEGWILSSKGRLVSSFHLADGRLTVNDKSISLSLGDPDGVIP